MNTENLNEKEEFEMLMSKFGGASSSVPQSQEKRDTKYQYSYVDLEYVMQNPTEYIIPQCLPACRALWGKNIETFMCSNNDDKDLYVLLMNLSDENKARMQELCERDSRFFYSEYRGTYGFGATGMSEESARELLALTGALNVQDTKRFQDVETFMREYRKTGGEYFIDEDGNIQMKENPELAKATLSEALSKTGKSSLYVASEGRVYESETFKKWHERYEQHQMQQMKDQIAEITPERTNINGDASNMRDSFLEAEREYVQELLKQDKFKGLIWELNQATPDVLFQMAEEITTSVDMGQVPDEQMEFTEQKLTVILAAIQDKTLIKRLVLTPSFSEEHQMSSGRSR